MKFKKEYLQNVIQEEEGELINIKILDVSRSSANYRAIFRFNGRFYTTEYEAGDDESPYEFEPDEIECDEVVPVEKTVIIYKNITP